MQPRNVKRRQWPARTAAAVAVVGLTAACGANANNAAPAVATTARMNVPVTPDGSAFTYTVTSLDCDAATIPGATPKGHYCVLGITVQNLSDAAGEPGIAFAKAYDPQGTAYLADAFAEIRSNTLLLDDLAPRATVTDRLIYDVPRTTKITSVVLSGSTTITLS